MATRIFQLKWSYWLKIAQFEVDETMLLYSITEGHSSIIIRIKGNSNTNDFLIR